VPDSLPTISLATLAFALAFAVTLAATPAARRLAIASGFYDHPDEGYKRHRQPTPHLGGVAVVAGLLAGSLAFAPDQSSLMPLLGCVLALHVMGVLDDRFGLPISTRLAGEAAAATVLWAAGWGWSVFGNGAADLVLTILWVICVVNAFNILDVLDGAAGSVACVSGAGIALLAGLEGQESIAILAIALSGACAGFLPHNLSNPARIFLGDGGSIAIGFALAATIMTLPEEGELGWTVLLAGVPILDTALVVLSRRKHGIPLLQGSLHGLSHRLLAGVGSERSVALVLATSQAMLCGVAVFLHELNNFGVAHGVLAVALLGFAALMVLDGEAAARPRKRFTLMARAERLT
jgi:UDP-GlcNAc:undecaprenyl-phosphate/decaprenyl-phosphate GlcNAc-1-phosphate transferase